MKYRSPMDLIAAAYPVLAAARGRRSGRNHLPESFETFVTINPGRKSRDDKDDHDRAMRGVPADGRFRGGRPDVGRKRPGTNRMAYRRRAMRLGAPDRRSG